MVIRVRERESSLPVPKKTDCALSYRRKEIKDSARSTEIGETEKGGKEEKAWVKGNWGEKTLRGREKKR